MRPERRTKEEVRPLPAQGGLSEPLGGISASCYARVLFSFTKLGKAAFLGHLDLMQVLERALARAGPSARSHRDRSQAAARPGRETVWFCPSASPGTS